MAVLLWLLLRTDSVAGPTAPPCEPIATDDAAAHDDALAITVPRLLYRRAFSDESPSQPPPARYDGVEPIDGDRGLRVRAAGGGRLRFTAEGPFPVGHAQRASLELFARTSTTVELELWDPVAGTRAYRALGLAVGEQHIEIELPWLRYDRGRVPQVSRATQWGLRFVEPAEVELRSFELWQDQLGADAELDVEHLVESFAVPERVSVYRRGPFVLLTDAPRLDPVAVLDALDRMHAHTRTVLPDMPEPTSVVPLLVFADERGYRQFWPRFAAHFGTNVAPLREDEGFTWLGVATAWFSDRYGAVRPVYVHEAHHALLERSYGLAAQRSWLFEGLANLEQLAISHQDLRDVYRRGLRRADASSTLLELADGRSIRTARYWQATLLCEWLLDDPGRRAALGSALQEMAHRGDTDLRPLVGRHFGVELDALAIEFWSWAWLRYGA